MLLVYILVCWFIYSCVCFACVIIYSYVCLFDALYVLPFYFIYNTHFNFDMLYLFVCLCFCLTFIYLFTFVVCFCGGLFYFLFLFPLLFVHVCVYFIGIDPLTHNRWTGQKMDGWMDEAVCLSLLVCLTILFKTSSDFWFLLVNNQDLCGNETIL